MVRHILGDKLCNIAKRFFAKICFIHDLARLVPPGRKNAFAANTLKSDTDTANARKQVYEFELFAVSVCHGHLIKSSTPTSNALAILVSVSMVGFGFTPDSTVTTVLRDKSASLDRRSWEIPLSCRIFFKFLAIFEP